MDHQALPPDLGVGVRPSHSTEADAPRAGPPPTRRAGPDRDDTDAPAGSDPDVALVRQAQQGGRLAFEMLLRRHYDRMHRVAWRLTGSRDDADDIVQEVCCGLVNGIAGFSGRAKFGTWLYGIVVNACHDHHRRRSTLRRCKDAVAVLIGLAPVPDGRDLYHRTWLASALGSLDPALRATAVLVWGEGLTHAEAAAALGVAETTVSWRLHEARRLLTPNRTNGDGR